MYKRGCIWVCGILLVSGCTAAQNFNLMVPDEAVPALKAKAASPEFSADWVDYLARADRMCDPDSPDYTNLDRLMVGLDDQPAKVRGHYLARHLTDWMQTLGLAYRLTGRQEYADHGIKVLVESAKYLTVDCEFMADAFAGTRGDAMRSLATGYDLFASEMSAGQRARVLGTTRGYLDDFIAAAKDPKTSWIPYHNYNGVCGGAAGLVALQLRSTDPAFADEGLQLAISTIRNWMKVGFDPQGAYCEGVLYSVYGLENILVFADVLKRSGGENLFENPGFEKVIDFYALSILPGETVLDARNDSPYENPGEILLKLAEKYNNGVAQWLYEPLPSVKHKRTWSAGGNFFLQFLWSGNVAPVAPDAAGMPLEKQFEGRGLCIWRTGWDREDTLFSIEAGKYYNMTHNQADKGHFTLYGQGYRWACDAGYANNQDPQGRAQTVAHNCVLIDGEGQALSGAALGTTGRILSYKNTPDYGYALADCTDAYRRFYSFNAVDRLTNPDGVPHEHMELDHAYRHTLFIKQTATTPAYAVILDDISKDEKPHDYRWQMLSWPDLEIEPNPPGALIASKDGSSARLFVFLDSETPLETGKDMYTPGDSHKPASYPRLKATCNAANPYFSAVLIPGELTLAPDVEYKNTPTQKTIRIRWPDGEDRLVWNKDAKPGSGKAIRFSRHWEK